MPDVKLVDELRAYLEDPAVYDATPDGVITQEYAARRRSELLDRLAEQEKVWSDRNVPYELPQAARALLKGDNLLRTLRRMRLPLRAGLAYGAADDDLADLERRALEQLCGVVSSRSLPQAHRMELDAIVLNARAIWLDPDSDLDVARYAFEIRLTRARAQKTRLGDIFLALPSPDAARLCVLFEVLQSSGERDPWRTSRGLIAWLCEAPRRDYFWVEEEEPHGGWRWVRRLDQLGLVDLVDFPEAEYTALTISEGSRGFLEDVAAGRETPLSALAATLLEEERSSTIATSVPSLERAQRESAVALIERQTRLVVHEFRNTLVPLQASLGALLRGMTSQHGEGESALHRQRVEQGFQRMFGFLSELEQTANLAVAAPAPFELSAVIQDAIAAVRNDHHLDVGLRSVEGLRVAGNRSRFVLALVSVLRNAAQVSVRPVAKVQIQVSLNASDELVVVQIDDDGPGVPLEDRPLVFERGFTRRTGGNGLGLALVREVVAAEMRGLVRCEAGDLGGARFVLAVPSLSRSIE